MLLALDSGYSPNLKRFDSWFSNVAQNTQPLYVKENLELSKCVSVSVNRIRRETSELHSLSHVCLKHLQEFVASRRVCLGRTNNGANLRNERRGSNMLSSVQCGGICSFQESNFQEMSDATSCILVARSERAASRMLFALHQISVIRVSASANGNHVSLFVFRASICFITATETTFLPFFPRGAKSSTCAPSARSRL